MTVLAKYQRLETEGIWRPSPSEQRKDVIVSIGKATVTIAAANGTALAHWSLPAIQRLNPGQVPAVFGPGGDAPETLELADDEVVGAIEKVLAAIRGKTENPSRLRTLAQVTVAGALVFGLAAWLPGAISRYTASLVPEVVRSHIGNDILAKTERVAGTPCSSPAGDRALIALGERLFPGRDANIVVLPSALAETAHLPDNIFLIGHRLVEDFETPEVVAGHLLAEDMRRGAHPPLARLLEAQGIRASLALLSKGRLRDDDTKRMAEWVVSGQPDPVSEQKLLDIMQLHGVASEPIAYAIDISGEKTLTLIEGASHDTQPVLSDTDWIALQGICDD